MSALDAGVGLEQRAALRTAVAAHGLASEGLRSASEAAARAHQLLADAEAKLAEFSDLEGQVAAHQAGAIKAWAAAGGERPSLSVPSDLADARRRRADTEADVAAMRAAHAALAGELAEQQAEAQRTEAAVAAAALAVQRAEIEAELDALAAADAAAHRIRVRLASYADTLPLRDMEAGRPPRLFNAFHDAQLPRHFTSDATQISAWQAYRRALTANPEATLDEALQGGATAPLLSGATP